MLSSLLFFPPSFPHPHLHLFDLLSHFQASLASIPTLVQSVVSCVRLLCERLSFIEPPNVTEAVYNLRRACRAAAIPEPDVGRVEVGTSAWGGGVGGVQVDGMAEWEVVLGNSVPIVSSPSRIR